MAIRGAFRLAFFDKRALGHFLNTKQAFWHSFQAIIFVAPIHFFRLTLGVDVLPEKTHIPSFFILQTLAFIIQWFAYPLMMLYVAKKVNREENYFRYIAMFNWANIPVNIIGLIAFLIFTTSATSSTLLFMSFVGFYIVIFHWFLACNGLEIRKSKGMLVTLLNIFLSFMITMMTTSAILS